MQLLAITIYTWSTIIIFFCTLVATKFTCVVDADVQVQKLRVDPNQLEVGRGKWEVRTAVGLYYFIWATAWYNPKVQLILRSRRLRLYRTYKN